MMPESQNAQIISRIAEDELEHYRRLEKLTGRSLKPNRGKVLFFTFITRLFGLTFGLKLLERDEDKAVNIDYTGLEEYLPGLPEIIDQEEAHEKQLLSYLGSVILGLNNALVELTGLSFAFQNTRLIALSWLITGIAAISLGVVMRIVFGVEI